MEIKLKKERIKYVLQKKYEVEIWLSKKITWYV